MLAGGMPSKELADFMNGLPLWIKIVWAVVWGGATLLIAFNHWRSR